MSITIVFFLGLFVALIGVIPPGLLNMTAAKISLKEGAGRGIMFSTGVCLVVFFQRFTRVGNATINKVPYMTSSRADLLLHDMCNKTGGA